LGTTTSIGSTIILANNGPPSTSLGSITVFAHQTLELVFTMTSGAGSHRSSINFNNLDVSASGITVVPEPVNSALAAFGVIFASTGVGRWGRGRLKRA
jgi:hypothetical protein